MKKLMLIGIAFWTTCNVWAQSPCDTLPVVNVVATDDTPCLGEEITLTASGGQTYQWNNGVSNGVPFTPSASDVFEVIVTDTIGCKDTVSVSIDVLPLPDVVANSSSLNICLGDSVLLNATNADSYTWLSPTIPNNTYYTPSAPGVNVFSVEGTGTNGCTNTSQVVVVVHDIPPLPTLNQDEIATCVNVPFEENITGTASVGRIIWFSDADLTQQYNEQPQLPVSNTTVGVTNYWATAFEAGCYSEGLEVRVEVYARPEVNAGEDISVKAGHRGELNATTNVSVEAEWTPETELDDPQSLFTAFTALGTTTYQLRVTDDNGCVNSDEVNVNVDTELIISNVMTPNGDGDNDVWKIYPESTLATCRVRLYDGFGRTMIYQDGYENDWDGFYKGKQVPDGDYYYHITCTGGFSKKGTLTILR